MKFTVAFVLTSFLALCLYTDNSSSLSSGIAISTKVVTIFDEIKLGKKHRYVTLVIRNEREIDVEIVGRRDATYIDFLKDIQVGGKAECRFGIFDLENAKCKSLFILSWCPETALPRQKVLYASSYLNLKDSLDGLGGHVQATENGEATEAAVLQSSMCITKKPFIK